MESQTLLRNSVEAWEQEKKVLQSSVNSITGTTSYNWTFNTARRQSEEEKADARTQSEHFIREAERLKKWNDVQTETEVAKLRAFNVTPAVTARRKELCQSDIKDFLHVKRPTVETKEVKWCVPTGQWVQEETGVMPKWHSHSETVTRFL